jgi:hypothetical protein
VRCALGFLALLAFAIGLRAAAPAHAYAPLAPRVVASTEGRAVAHVAVATPVPDEGQVALGYLNAQRSANGIPPLALDQSLATSWCPEVDAPGPDAAGRVLGSGGVWEATYSPWEAEALEQFVLYDPAYTEAGLSIFGGGAVEAPSEPEGAECAGLAGSQGEPLTPTFYAFTSTQGPGHVPEHGGSQDEGPFAVQELAGHPQGAMTGPQLLLYAEGLADGTGGGPEVALASLVGPTGAVVPGVVVVDSAMVEAAKDSDELSGGAVIVPPPLAPGSYHASVAWVGGDGEAATQSLSFTVTPGVVEQQEAASPRPLLPGHKPKAKPTPKCRPSTDAKKGHPKGHASETTSKHKAAPERSCPKASKRHGHAPVEPTHKAT